MLETSYRQILGYYLTQSLDDLEGSNPASSKLTGTHFEIGFFKDYISHKHSLMHQTFLLGYRSLQILDGHRNHTLGDGYTGSTFVDKFSGHSFGLATQFAVYFKFGFFVIGVEPISVYVAMATHTDSVTIVGPSDREDAEKAKFEKTNKNPTVRVATLLLGYQF